MGIYKHIRKMWRSDSPEAKKLRKERLMKWRREPATVRIERPTRLDRARSLGYKPKQGIILVRQRVIRGGHTRKKPQGGRRSKNMTRRKNLDLNYRGIAERRVSRAYPNCEVLNSYFVGKDGRYIWHEIILLARDQPQIQKDPRYSKVVARKGRAHRGLTSAHRKSRGLRHKGKGAEKLR